MSALSKASITAVLGPVGEDLATQIVSSGANERELFEAKAWLDNDEALHDELRTFPKGRVAELVELISTFDPPPEDA
mgnify:CR=1 FL=1